MWLTDLPARPYKRSMDDDVRRWNRVKQVFQDALERPAAERGPFLRSACGDDRELQGEVESLLVAHAAAGSFAQGAAIETLPPLATDALANPSRPRYIGSYEVLSFVGAGGMGEVYRARDPRLGREVAIKVLPETFAQDPEHEARFEREAQMLAALNHPHIAQVYGFENAHSSGSGERSTNALVMELVEGETLTHVLEKGALPVSVALRHATQIADALAAAHSRGIVHRDLKPGNVMITPAGVKVLDFGLAKRPGKTGASLEASTLAVGTLTTPGQILGTVAYMSPEQAEGKPVDARSDVFAFGVVLYEMLCGQRPFTGDSALATLASTLRATPERPRSLRKEIPEGVDRIVMRCLEKEPADRYGSAAELQRALTAVAVPSTSFSIQRVSLAVAAVAILVGAAGLGARSYVQASRVRWVEEKAVPQISRLINENRRLAALTLFQEAQRYAPGSRKLFTLEEGVAAIPVTFRSSPAGARVYISDYAAGAGEDLSEWRLLGETPVRIDQLPRWGYYRVLAVKQGFASAERAYFALSGRDVELTLHSKTQAPAGMVWVPAGGATSPAPQVKLPGYWIDRFEVTNRQFKEFVDAGGYRKAEYWKQPFSQNGRTLSFAQALEAFHDATGRPGPANWRLGTYPDGSDDMPVGGISWYEAMAYAEFAGKNLPTVYEWFGAAALVQSQSGILTLSNFRGGGPAKVGANRGMGPYGTYDMAGNVKEWTANPTNDRHYLLGGAWNEDDYVFDGHDARPPFSREVTFGFRCVRRPTSPAEETFQAVSLGTAFRERGAPVDDQTLRRFLDLHAYEKSALDSRVERIDRSSPYWRRETVSFQAAYANERVIAHLFLPANAEPPYQVVVFFGGSNVLDVARTIDEVGFPYQFLARSGRAVVIPVYSGSLERGPSPFTLPRNQERDRAIRWSMDLGRTVDYMETRPDLDTKRLAFYGVSLGAAHGPRLVAVDGRFKTLVLVSGGLYNDWPEETDTWNFAPRVHLPVLMMNGRSDFMVPYEPNQRMLFESLGAKEKVFKRYDGGHANLVTRPDLIGEILSWLDKYLGPVDVRP
jgi:serine/threonine protein kinase/formylglycine-generating enzyme required for sulfatase activity/dienelactone hydrolase